MAGKRRLGPLIITNPTESDSDSDSDVPVPRPRQISPRGALDSIEPPLPLFNHLSRSQSSITNPADDLSASSRSSPAPDTTPPPTPGLTHPPGVVFSHKQSHDADSHGIGRAPHHIRRPSNEPPSHPSPTLSISHPYAPVSPVTEHHLEHRIIMATEDSAVYHKVNITTSRTGEAIRELIFSALQIPDEDQFGFALYQDIETALDEPLTDKQLFDLCLNADRSGSLKFIIQRRSAHVYLRPDIRALPPPPITAPPLPHERHPHPNNRQGTRPGPQSQHDTSSSTSDRRIDPNPPYHDSLSDGFEQPPFAPPPRHRVGLLRPSPSQPQLPRLPPAQQQPQRPPVGIKFLPKQSLTMGASPVNQRSHNSPGGLSNGTSDSSSSNQLPSVAPLQIDRTDRRGSITPTPPSHSLYSGRDVGEVQTYRHVRRGSETAAERERALEHSERIEARRDRERRERAREKERERRDKEREKERTHQMRTEETKRWWEQQGGYYPRTGSSTSQHSPSDTLSPGGTWQGTDRPELKSRPGTTGTAPVRPPRQAQFPADRPSTAQPIVRPHCGSYQTRTTPSAASLISGTGRTTPNASVSGSPSVVPRGLQPAFSSPRHNPQLSQHASAGPTPPTVTLGQQLDFRGQPVPPDWMVRWRGQDTSARATAISPPIQSRLPHPNGSKSMDNLRNLYVNGPGSSPRIRPTPLQTGPAPRRLPTPLSQRSNPSNYGGSTEAGASTAPPYTSPIATLPYHDQRLPTGQQQQQRGNPTVASATTTPSDYSSRPGSAPWRAQEERPRSPPYERPGIGLYRMEVEPREPRPSYAAPPVRQDVHANQSWGQAAQNLSPSLGLTSRESMETLDIARDRERDRERERERSSPPTLTSPLEVINTTAESTLQQSEHGWIVDMLEGKGQSSEESTIIPSHPVALTDTAKLRSPVQTPTVTTPGPITITTPVSPSDDGEYDEEMSESESEAGTLWQPRRNSKRVSKMGLHPILTTTPAPPVPPVPPLPPVSYRGGANGRQQLSPGGNVNRYSSFTKRDSVTWAFRPPPEDMYERLEEFFPDHDLDRPVIETPSGGSSPTQAEHPPPPAFPSPNRAKHKKSIRVVAHERASKIGSTARDVLRKRSTKLWGSRVEEVTPAQAKGSIHSATPDSPPGLPTSKPIFKWVKGELIGKGTYGRVYLALNATTGEMIAVKQVELPKTASDQNDGRQLQVVEALMSESDTLKDLDHPNIVQYLGFEQSADHWSIFLEYVPGGSIGGCLRKHGKFDHEVVRSFTSQMLSGLEYLHLRGVLHRDLKADNILVDPSGICKISDFGISKRSDGIYDNNTGLTAMQGSIFWMAPEMLHNNKQGYNAKIDIWSLGCVVLEMWAGRRPWNQEDIVAVMFKLGAEKAAPPVPDDVKLDPIEDDFRLQCFAVNPNERPTAAELRKHKFLEVKPGWTFVGFT